MKPTAPVYRLEAIRVAGFKSFDQEGQVLRLGNVTVLIGSNGAGKSNVVGLFSLLQSLVNQQLQNWTLQRGGAPTLLHYGPKTTEHISLDLSFRDNGLVSKYHLKLGFVVRDKLVIVNEAESHTNTALGAEPKEPGRLREPEGGYHPRDGFRLESTVFHRYRSSEVLRRCRAYQFHDTSDRAAIRLGGFVRDNAILRADGGNLAPFLYRLQQAFPTHYQRITETVRLVVPGFQQFVLQPNPADPQQITLDWTDGTDYVFGTHQFSDGSLRFIALVTLLLQPRELLPGVIVLDEPELGLHPAALHLLVELIRARQSDCQILLATQSAELLDHFSPAETVIVEYDAQRRRSTFRYLDPAELDHWLADYSLSQLWDKNLLGGRP